MKTLILTIFLALPFSVYSQNPKIVNLSQLQHIINEKSDQIKIINFWATWCAPCIKELPLFEKVNKRADVQVILVSMDLDLDSNPDKVYKFVSRKKLESTVLILDEKNPNSWINQLESQWSGAIPATLLINSITGQRKFVEKELHDDDLERLIEEVRTKN